MLTGGSAIESLAARSPVPVELHVTDRRRGGPTPFTVGEALTNIAKYAHATQAHVTVAVDGDRVADRRRRRRRCRYAVGPGLRGLADRLDALGGTLDVQSGSGAERGCGDGAV